MFFMNKINVAVFFGGDSLEHDISVITGSQIIKALDKSKYNIYPIYIDGNDKWWHIKNFHDKNDINSKNKKLLTICSGENYFYFKNLLKTKIKIHVAVLALHGGKGENGSISGILEAMHIPYTSSNVLSSAITLDKQITKLILQANGYNVLPYIAIQKKDKNLNTSLKSFIDNHSYPLIVKPCNMGSSIGVTLVKNDNELQKAIKLVFNFTDTAIVEKGIENVLEYNCSAMRIGNKILVSDIEKPIHHDEILSFADKYGSKQGCKFDKSGSKGMQSLSREFPAKIDNELESLIKQTTEKAYIDFKCTGIIRCDFIYYEGNIYLNEINAIPGSLAFYLWATKGYNFKSLLDEIIKESIHSCLTN